LSDAVQTGQLLDPLVQRGLGSLGDQSVPQDRRQPLVGLDLFRGEEVAAWASELEDAHLLVTNEDWDQGQGTMRAAERERARPRTSPVRPKQRHGLTRISGAERACSGEGG
jgi:hypothetical protein